MRIGGHGLWIALFAGAVALVALGVEAFYRTVGCHSISACRIDDLETAVIDGKKTVLFGASVTYGAFYYMPSIDAETLNLSTIGSTTVTGNTLLLEDLLDRTDGIERVFYFSPAELYTKQPLKDDATQRNYFSNVFDTSSHIVRATALYEARERELYRPALARIFERRFAILLQPRARLREIESRNRALEGATMRWWLERNADLPEPPIGEEPWKAHVGARRARAIVPFAPSVQAANALERFAELCRARALACHIVLSPTHEVAAAALAADAGWSDFRAAHPEFCWLDMNGPRVWPSGAFRDELHLIRPWELYYRKVLMAEVLPETAPGVDRAAYVRPGSEAACAGFVGK